MKLFPNFSNYEPPFMLRVAGTVILRIWWQLLFVLIYTVALVYLHIYIDLITIDFPTILVTILGVVTGLLLVFRTNTAYERYWEGRKLWAIMIRDIRTLTRFIWVYVAEKEGTGGEVVEKITAINLLIAFVYATRNYLRENYSYEEPDLRKLISHLPKFSTPSSNQSLITQEEAENRLRCETAVEACRTLTTRPSIVKAYEVLVPTNIPVELTYFIAQYINSVRERELTDFCAIGAMNNAVNSLVECLGGFERILRTPMPFAYSVHLHHAIWIYILALPFQLIGKLGWFAVPAIVLSAFTLLGILSIGWEIENPFGLDDNDLPLDDFCKVLHKEILRITGQKMPDPKTWLYSKENKPFSQTEPSLGADVLVQMPEDDVRHLLVKGSQVRLSKRMRTVEKKIDGGEELDSVATE